MKTGRIAIFGLLLTGAVAVAVASVVAQPRSDDRWWEQPERTRPRVMMLDGRGARIGVSVQDLDDQGLKAAGDVQSGVRIDEVDADGPASKAGVQEGDIVVDVDGERVRSARQFSRLIQETPDGRTVRLGVVRGGKRQTIEVRPESRAFGFGVEGDLIGREIARNLREIEPRLRELEPQLRELEPRLREFRFNGPLDFDFKVLPRLTSPRGRLGVQINELTPQLAEYFGAKDGGVLVSSVTKDSPADRAGLKAGDIITSIDGDRVRGTEDLIDELREKDGEVTVGILRERKESSVKATLDDLAPRRSIRRPA
jgi:serine protease Do